MEHRSDAYGPKGRISQPREKYEIRTTIVVIFCIISSIFYPLSRVTSETPEVWQLEVIEPELISQVPHDNFAFTQGLEIHGGKFYESTGLYGQSSVRIVNMSTGQIEAQYNLSDDYFAEGLTIWNNSIIQLTWKENIGFIYDLQTLQQIGNFSYQIRKLTFGNLNGGANRKIVFWILNYLFFYIVNIAIVQRISQTSNSRRLYNGK